MPHQDKGPASKIAASTAALPLTSAGTRSTADNNAATTKHMRSWHHLTQTNSEHLNDIRNMWKFQAIAPQQQPQQHCLRHTTSACSSTADGGRGQRRVLMRQVLHHHHHLHRAVQQVHYSPCSQADHNHSVAHSVATTALQATTLRCCWASITCGTPRLGT
jgi:hypothetical protein